jgi:hypothetical protein
VPNPVGRPRIHENDAAKARAYRERKRAGNPGGYPPTTFSTINPDEKMGAGIPRWEGPGREPLRINEDR